MYFDCNGKMWCTWGNLKWNSRQLSLNSLASHEANALHLVAAGDALNCAPICEKITEDDWLFISPVWMTSSNRVNSYVRGHRVFWYILVKWESVIILNMSSLNMEQFPYFSVRKNKAYTAMHMHAILWKLLADGKTV
jgi:hypothetical protein